MDSWSCLSILSIVIIVLYVWSIAWAYMLNTERSPAFLWPTCIIGDVANWICCLLDNKVTLLMMQDCTKDNTDQFEALWVLLLLSMKL